MYEVLLGIPINNNKLQRLKYKGLYEVIKHIGNAVTCRYTSTNKEEVLPVDKLIKFDNSRDDALRVAQLEDVPQTQGHKGYTVTK